MPSTRRLRHWRLSLSVASRVAPALLLTAFALAPTPLMDTVLGLSRSRGATTAEDALPLERTGTFGSF